jgi:hypothetical protein
MNHDSRVLNTVIVSLAVVALVLLATVVWLVPAKAMIAALTWCGFLAIGGWFIMSVSR